MAEALEELPRGWWGLELPGYREGPQFVTYFFDHSDLPPIDRNLDDELSWLLGEPPVPDSLSTSPLSLDPCREATSDGLNLLLGSRRVSLPRSFRTFIALDEPRRRVRSPTACYLDLGDFITPVVGGPLGDAWLLHFLSDQQWVMHWLLYGDDAGHEAVVATDVPFGFEADEDSPRPFPKEFDPRTTEAAVCAESFSEFLYRFWIENEIWFALTDPDASPPRLTAEQLRYLAHYRR